MTNKEYQEAVLKTESCDMESIKERVSDENIRLLHAGIGIATESGELLDQLKKHIFYGKPLDKLNLIEEIGDLYWYINVAQDVLGISADEIQRKNVAKLEARYGGKFSEEAAVKRNLSIEDKALRG